MDNYPDSADEIPDMDAQHEELVDFLSSNEEMRKAAKNSLKQGLFAGGGAVMGGLLLGPIGGLVGGVAGSIAGFFQAEDYDGILQQLLRLDGAHKEKLVYHTHRVLRGAGATSQQLLNAAAFRSALLMLASQRDVRDKVWQACLDVVRD